VHPQRRPLLAINAEAEMSIIDVGHIPEPRISPPSISAQQELDNHLRPLLEDALEKIGALEDILHDLKYYDEAGFKIAFIKTWMDRPLSRVLALAQMRADAEEWLEDLGA
jgi:hypothetical protein